MAIRRSVNLTGGLLPLYLREKQMLAFFEDMESFLFLILLTLLAKLHPWLPE